MDADGNLAGREVFGPSSLGTGAWPDGIAFDAVGNLWGTMVYSDKLFVLTPEGHLKVLLDEGDPEKVNALEEQFFRNSVTGDVLFATGRGIAPWMASVTFGGADLKTVYLGSLDRDPTPVFSGTGGWTSDGALERIAGCQPLVLQRLEVGFERWTQPIHPGGCAGACG